jgi:hypothetical protein
LLSAIPCEQQFSWILGVITMSYKITHATTQTVLKNNEAIIIAVIDGGKGLLGIARGDKTLSMVGSLNAEFIVGNVDSINIALNDAVSHAKAEGLKLIEDSPVEALAKTTAVATVFNSHAEESWEFDFYTAIYADDDSEFSCRFANVASDYECLSGANIVEKLEEIYSGLTHFAASVLKMQPKKWLIKSDYDGGYEDAYVLTGSREDARESALWTANLIAGVNGHHEHNRDEWVFKDLDVLFENIGVDDEFWNEHDCSIIYKLSIEEV